MLKVLFVDDEIFRFNEMRSKGIIPEDSDYAGDAITGMKKLDKNGPYDVVFLDHDLNTIDPGPYPYEITGYDVVRFIVQLPWKPSQVFVHSMNPVGSKNMMDHLTDNGINAIRKPIYQFISYSNYPDMDGLDIEGNPQSRLNDD